MKGEEFLNEKYPNLNLSEEVRHTSKGTKNKDEAVARYMERLERTHEKASERNRLDLLKKMYHDKYVVKESDIPRYSDKERIINAQKESLDKWLDYLLDENAKYPMWAKYWAFQGMLQIGTYNEATGTYNKRNNKTLAPFIEVNPEILAKCIGMVANYVEKDELTNDELNKLVESGNFQKLYTILQKKHRNQLTNIAENTDGIWITYHHETEKEANQKQEQGIEPEYIKLYNSLQGYNTGWCTAGDIKTAKDQICGIIRYVGGNFYIYYTKNDNGEYKVPRIAIRMNQKNIGEIRGIADGQNIEDGLENIVEEKLKTFDGINKDYYLEIINNMKYLTLLNKKNKNQEQFTEEDIKFIYELDKKIDTFGYLNDPKINKIISERDKEKDAKILTNDEDNRKFWVRFFKEAPSYIKNDVKIALEAVKQNSYALEYVPEATENYFEIALEAVKQNGYALGSVPKTTENYFQIALEAVKEFGLALKYVPEATENYFEIALEAVKQNGHALAHVSETVENYDKIVLEAVKKNGCAFEHVPTKKENYFQIALEAVKQNGHALESVLKTTENYFQIALEAVKQNGHALEYVPKTIENYDKIALEAVKQNVEAINYVPVTMRNIILNSFNKDDLEYMFEKDKSGRKK